MLEISIEQWVLIGSKARDNSDFIGGKSPPPPCPRSAPCRCLQLRHLRYGRKHRCVSNLTRQVRFLDLKLYVPRFGYGESGLDWGTNLLAFIAMGLYPILLFLFFYILNGTRNSSIIRDFRGHTVRIYSNPTHSSRFSPLISPFCSA